MGRIIVVTTLMRGWTPCEGAKDNYTYSSVCIIENKLA
jgi:hypothetical protein